MASKLMTGFYVAALLVCGSLNTITMKISYTLKSDGIAEQDKTFAKPWFTTFAMFVAMAYALVVEGCRYYRRDPTSNEVPLMYEYDSPKVKGGITWAQKVVLVSIPSVFDILATGLCSMGFLYIPASVWQLLRGAEMVFAAIFAVIFLRKRLFVFNWLGIMLCCVGIALVGMASLWGGSSADEEGGSADSDEQTSLLLLGMGLALGGQVVQAAQVIAEEWLLKEVDLPGLQIIGFEGVWGGAIMALFMFPAMYFMPGSDGGRFEDEVDTVVMLENNMELLGLILLFTFSCTTYNMAGIAVTESLSAVHRVMLEALRTAVVWAFGLAVHYFMDPKSKFGEAWTPYSWLEVVGFACLMFGQAVYGSMLKIPGLYYPPDEEMEMHRSPSPSGAIRNIVSPSLPHHRESAE